MKNERFSAKTKIFKISWNIFPFTDSSWIEQEGNLGSDLGRNTTELIKYSPSAL